MTPEKPKTDTSAIKKQQQKSRADEMKEKIEKRKANPALRK